MAKNEIVPDDWIAAGYRRYESNKIINPNVSFMVQKRVFEEDTGITRYFISVDVYDYEGKKNMPYRWGFSPRVQFSRDVTLDVTLHTDDPFVAEAEIAALWVAIGKPYDN